MRVICTLPNAGERISGVQFEKTDGGMLSASIPADTAAAFARIPGYVLVEEVAPEPEPDPAAGVSPAHRAAAELERRRRKAGAESIES
jgi:hypothetical protein